MAVKLAGRIENYAIYTPSLPRVYVEFVAHPKHAPRRSIHPRDLNLLDHRSCLWTYPNAMASAGHLAFTKKPNAITQRHPSSSHIIGDSAGYQIGTGALTEIKSWARHAREPELIAKLWRESTVLGKILRWLELHCDVATTVDMPLWARLQKSGKSPFQGCSVELLTELTVQNLRYFSDHQGLVGSCQFLNVLHFDTEAAEEHWYEMVRPYRFEGWATAGRAGGSLPF